MVERSRKTLALLITGLGQTSTNRTATLPGSTRRNPPRPR